jgi:hypothetical protein
MPAKLLWTEALDTRIRRLRGEGATWDAIAMSLSLTRSAVVERGRRIGARMPPPGFVARLDDPQRDPLPAGHPRTWGVMNAGTVLADEPYPRQTPHNDRKAPFGAARHRRKET